MAMEGNRITEESQLKDAISASLSKITEEVKDEVGSLETEYISYRRKQRLAVLVVAAGFLLPNLVIFSMEILAAGITGWWSNLINILVFLASVTLFGYFGFHMFVSGITNIKKFHGSVDHVLFARTFSLLGVEGKLIEHTATLDERVIPETKWGNFRKKIATFVREHKKSPEAEMALEYLKVSELITEPFNVSVVDNLFEIKIADNVMHGAELDIQQVTGSGRNRQVKKIFKGYFVSYELPHVLDGKTFVSTEGDKFGFGHRTFWSEVTYTGATETKLEWNDFEELLHVATTDRVEARYILTPKFMQELYTWWKPHETNIRISFIGNRVCMLYPDDQIRIDETVANINEKEIESYILSISRPLLHVVRLIEGVRMS